MQFHFQFQFQTRKFQLQWELSWSVIDYQYMNDGNFGLSKQFSHLCEADYVNKSILYDWGYKAHLFLRILSILFSSSFVLGEAQRVSGKFSGGLNGHTIEPVDMHAYVITSDGRTYTAISRMPAELGVVMQTLFPIGGILGWLYAVPKSPMAKNGFMLTGLSLWCNVCFFLDCTSSCPYGVFQEGTSTVRPQFSSMRVKEWPFVKRLLVVMSEVTCCWTLSLMDRPHLTVLEAALKLTITSRNTTGLGKVWNNVHKNNFEVNFMQCLNVYLQERFARICPTHTEWMALPNALLWMRALHSRNVPVDLWMTLPRSECTPPRTSLLSMRLKKLWDLFKQIVSPLPLVGFVAVAELLLPTNCVIHPSIIIMRIFIVLLWGQNTVHVLCIHLISCWVLIAHIYITPLMA